MQPPPRAVSQSLPPSLSNTDVSPVHFPSLSTLQGPRITYYSVEAHPVGTNPTDGCTSAEATPPFLDVAQLKVGSQSYFRRSYLPSYYSTHSVPFIMQISHGGVLVTACSSPLIVNSCLFYHYRDNHQIARNLQNVDYNSLRRPKKSCI